MLKMLIILYFFLRKAKFAMKSNQIYADSDQALNANNAFHKKLERLLFLVSCQEDKSW